MKLLKIVLIIALLIVMCFGISLGKGTITSGDKTIDMADIKEMYSDREYISTGTTDAHWEYKYIREEPEEPNSLNEWFRDLSLSEKIELYNYWKEVDHD